MSKKFALGLIFLLASFFSSQVWSQDSVQATYYAKKFHRKKTASGEQYLKNAYTCAHKTLPFGTYLLVKNQNNGNEVIVRVNDRMSSRSKSDIDLSYAAAADLDMIARGSNKVTISVLDSKTITAKRDSLSDNKM